MSTSEKKVDCFANVARRLWGVSPGLDGWWAMVAVSTVTLVLGIHDPSVHPHFGPEIPAMQPLAQSLMNGSSTATVAPPSGVLIR